MQQSLISEELRSELSKVKFIVGSIDELVDSHRIYARKPFDDVVIDFLNELSKNLLKDKEAKIYPDVVTLAFWIRKASVINLKERFDVNDGNVHLGRGMVFHIAPSNVPVNYAYSLVTGLLTGNANIVRIPTKDFEQVRIINKVINDTIVNHPQMQRYIYLVRYDRNKEVNDIFSKIADLRVVWGGDRTIEELRKSPIQPRTMEVNFADRYSLAIIDSDDYLELENKNRFAEDFYNDTFLSDQNACTSPRVVVWTGNSIPEAKEVFWSTLHTLVEKKYTFQPIMGVNKLTSSYIAAATHDGIGIVPHSDNLIVRVTINSIDKSIMDLKDNSGYFYEYNCKDIMELADICDDARCQTIGYLGDKNDIISLVSMGLRGIDRVVPIGKTMDFDLIWDGYNLYERFTRVVSIELP